MSRIVRVFPRRTKATPVDAMTVVCRPPGWFDECDAVHISVAFSWDLRRAEELAVEWGRIAPVTIGGPAVNLISGQASGDFVPGLYLKPGYTITSRGCPNKCWFCRVWEREGPVRELPIRDGWNILDDNLLACSEEHIRDVFVMLRRVKAQGHRIELTGGLEAARLKPWHIDELLRVKPKQMFFAYDSAGDLEPLRNAGALLLDAGWSTASKTLRAYVLCGWAGDSLSAAEQRMHETQRAGFTPMAMLYRGPGDEEPDGEWRTFQRQWARPALQARDALDREENQS